jgi:cob(I)alamin adenosyltransferase
VNTLRYIEELVLKNWMSHEHSVIKFHPHINVITGTSDSGKSAIYRAIEYVYNMGQDGYRSFHSGWVRYKTSNATIQIKYSDGTMLERVKGEKNEIRLYKDGEVFYEKLKAGTTYDKEVLDFLGNPPYERSLGSFSFAHQHDPAFLMSQSKDAIPKIISKLSNSGDYDRSAEILKNENLSFNPIIKASEAKIKTIKKDLELFDDLDADIVKYDELEEAIATADVLTKDINSLNQIVATARKKKNEVISLENLNSLEQDKLSYLENLDDIQEIVDQIEVLKTILNDIVNKEQTIADLTYQNTQAEFFVSLEFKKAILFMDNCIEIIDGLKSIQNDLNDLGEELAEANESQENDELSLTGFDDKISAIEAENAEYEAYMNKNNICLVCGK